MPSPIFDGVDRSYAHPCYLSYIFWLEDSWSQAEQFLDLLHLLVCVLIVVMVFSLNLSILRAGIYGIIFFGAYKKVGRPTASPIVTGVKNVIGEWVCTTGNHIAYPRGSELHAFDMKYPVAVNVDSRLPLPAPISRHYFYLGPKQIHVDARQVWEGLTVCFCHLYTLSVTAYAVGVNVSTGILGVIEA